MYEPNESIKWKRARKRPVEIAFREVESLHLLYRDVYSNKISEHYKGLEWVPIKGEIIQTLEGTHYALPDTDFIIRDVHGEIYPIKKNIFYETYKVLEE